MTSLAVEIRDFANNLRYTLLDLESHTDGKNPKVRTLWQEAFGNIFLFHQGSLEPLASEVRILDI